MESCLSFSLQNGCVIVNYLFAKQIGMESYAKKLKWLGKKIKRKKKNESFSLESTFLEGWELYFATKVTSMNIFGDGDFSADLAELLTVLLLRQCNSSCMGMIRLDVFLYKTLRWPLSFSKHSGPWCYQHTGSQCFDPGMTFFIYWAMFV